MKRVCFGLFIYVLVSFNTCIQAQNQFKNDAIKELSATHQRFLQLSATVDSLSFNLSSTERERAAFFLESVYSLVMQAIVERGDPAHPMLTEWMEKPRKFAGDNPYTIYTQAPVNDRSVYRLSGKKGSNIYLGVQVYCYKNGFNLPSSHSDHTQIQFEADGSFELYLSAEPPVGVKNWLKLSPDDHTFLIRQYFDSRENNVPSQFKIECVDLDHRSGISYLDRIRRAHDLLDDYILGTIEVSSILRQNALNKYPAKDAAVRAPKYGGALYPTKDNRYEGCWVSLKPGEAMRIHGFLPQNTMYASYVFYDRWYNTPSYPEVNCFRTMEEIVLNSDGSFDLYISPETIDHPNWLNTGGLYEGSYSSRYMKSTETRFPDIEIVQIKDIQPLAR